MNKTDIFKLKVYQLTNNDYTILGNYINCHTKIKIRHNICNTEYEVKPNYFLNGTRCPICAKYLRQENNSKDINTFTKEFYELVGNEYTLLSDYINSRTKIKIRHNICNNEYEVTPNKFQQGKRCPYCSKNKKKTTESFKKEVYELVGNEYSVLNEYKNTSTKIKMKHNICDNIYEVTPSNFLYHNNRCPYCRESKGEKRIIKYLDNHNYIYERQYKFNDCKYKKELPFDFKLEDKNGNIILIEYDGIQHEKGYFIYNEEEFNNLKKRDSIKDEYCNKRSNITLYRISYKDFDNIEIILDNIFKNFN